MLNQFFGIDQEELIRYQNSVENSLDVTALLNNSSEDAYLEKRTLKQIADDVYDSLEQALGKDNPHILSICSKLTTYRFVKNIEDISIGRFTRFIRKSNTNSILAVGGNVSGVKYLKSGTYVQICNKKANRVFNYNFNDYVTFQKLSQQEMLCLYANEMCMDVSTKDC